MSSTSTSSLDPAKASSKRPGGGDATTVANANDESGSGKRRKSIPGTTPSMSEEESPSLAGSAGGDNRRRLRNEREQKRSAHISEQFDTLRDLMVQAGVIVPQGTRATILEAAKQYIDLLQEKERQANEEKGQLARQLRQIQAAGSMEAPCVRNVSHDNVANAANANNNPSVPTMPSRHLGADYSTIFQKSPVAMAIAGLGGFLVECNDRFHRLVGCSNDEDLIETSIFSLIADQDMATALDRITKWLMDQQPPDSDPRLQQRDTKSILTLRSNVTTPPSLGASANVRYQLNFAPIWEPGQTLQLDSSSSNGIVSSSLQYLCVSLLPQQQVSPQRTVSPPYGMSNPLLVPTPFPDMFSGSNNSNESPSFDDASFSTSSGGSPRGNTYNFGGG